MSTYDSNKIPVEKLASSIEKWVDKEIVHLYFQQLFQKHENKWRRDLKSEHWKNSFVRKVLQVHERVLFTDFLKEQINDEFSTRLYYPQLITYLRLTCFDQLGQPVKWSSFQNWLKSKKQKAQVEKSSIISLIKSEDPTEISLEMYSGYQKLFGNKISFFNFINNVISKGQKEKLLQSIKIRISNYSSPLLVREVKEEEKLNYLYKIRNDFTHNTFNKEPIANISKEEKEWSIRETIMEGKNELWISTSSNFQFILKNCILEGIAQQIKRNQGI